jgi:surface antigen
MSATPLGRGAQTLRRGSPFWRALTALVATVAIVAGSLIAAPSAFAAVDDYPAKWKTAPRDSLVDTWGMYNRECVSWVAWALHKRNGFEMPFHANASYWSAKSKLLGFKVDHTPTVGSVAWWASNHVAWVEAVNVNGTIQISEYNIGGSGKYNLRTIAATVPSAYIHYKDMAVDLSDGKFISYLGKIYVIVGGAPMYVSNWVDFGGKHPVGAVTSTQWATLHIYPTDGVLVTAYPSGHVYRMVGGAPIYISSWAGIGGVQPTIRVSDTNIHNAGSPTTSAWGHLLYYPADASYVTVGTEPKIYKIVGGAADPIVDWASVGGVQPSVQIGADDIAKAGAATTSAYGHLKGRIVAPVPGIKGVLKVGHTLTAVHGTWSPTTVALSYQWMRDGVAIPSAHNKVHKLVAADKGAVITVVITGVKSHYRTTVVTSVGTPVIT